MDASLLVLNENFESLHITNETISNYMKLEESQLEHMFMKFEFSELSNRIRNFYNTIEEIDNQKIKLSHELIEKESVIQVTAYMILIENYDDNMFLPLLKRLFRNHILMEV